MGRLRGRLREKPFLLALLGLLALAGCATNEITGRSQLLVVPESMAISSSATAYSSMMGDLGKKKQVEPPDAERTKKVHEISNRLIAQAIRFRPDSAKWNWEVQVINDPKTVNAFCMAGGKMAIYTGLLEQLKATDDEIAQVMGHEIAHALAYSCRTAARARARPTGSASSSPRAPATIRRPPSRSGKKWRKPAARGRRNSFRRTRPQNRREQLAQLGPQMEPFYLEAKANPLKEAPSFLDRKKGAPS